MNHCPIASLTMKGKNMDNNYEALMVRSENVDYNIFTINILSNFIYHHSLITKDFVMVAT